MRSAAVVERPELKLAAGGMLAAAALWPWLPAHPPLVCPLRTATGIPCPLCGMTRAVVALVHGDVGASLRYHPLGVAAVVLAIVLLVRPRLATLVRVPPWTIVAGALAVWTYNVALNPTF